MAMAIVRRRAVEAVLQRPQAAAAAAAWRGFASVEDSDVVVVGRKSEITSLKDSKEGAAEVEMRRRFEEWMAEYGRTYKDEEEKARRFVIFKSNAEFVDKINAKKNEAWLSTNRFGDMTYDEVREMYDPRRVRFEKGERFKNEGSHGILGSSERATNQPTTSIFGPHGTREELDNRILEMRARTMK